MQILNGATCAAETTTIASPRAGKAGPRLFATLDAVLGGRSVGHVSERFDGRAIYLVRGPVIEELYALLDSDPLFDFAEKYFDEVDGVDL